MRSHYKLSVLGSQLRKTHKFPLTIRFNLSIISPSMQICITATDSEEEEYIRQGIREGNSSAERFPGRTKDGR